MANDALRKRFSTTFAENFYSEFKSNSDNQYLLFVGRISPWNDENTPDASTDSVYHSNYAWRNTIALKRIDVTNVFHVIPRYNWASGTVFAEYDDDTDLFSTTTKFYIFTEDDNVYKCIYNNDGAESTQKPTSTGTEIITTDDGYRWKFMYRISEDAKRFLTDEYIPVTSVISEPRPDDEKIFQWNSQSTAVHGSIDDIRIGTTGDAKYSSSTLQSKTVGEAIGYNAGANIKGQNQVILNNAADVSDDAYNNYVLYIDGGRGSEIGQVKRIIDYVGNERKAILHESLDEDLHDNETTYVIRPELVISGDGVGAKVVMTMNSNKTIKSTKTIDVGKDYTYATGRITTTKSAGTNNPTISLEISPKGGHNHNTIHDFEASRILIVMKLEGDEGGLFSVENDFRQFGIIKNPTLATGPHGGEIAGTEINKLSEFSVRKPYNISSFDYDFTSTSPTFKNGNYILGNSTRSSAKIESWRASTSNNKDGILEVSRIRGGFSGPSPQKKLVRVDVNTSLGSGNYTIGERVFQNVGITAANAKGKVHSWISDNNELIVEVENNTFSGVTGGITGEVSGAGYGPPFLDFSDAGGELLKQFKSGATGYFELVNIAGNTQDHGRIVSINDTVKSQDVNPTYRQTHKLTISGSALNKTTFTKDAGFTQQDGGATTGSLRLTSGNVVEWVYGTTGSTGALHLTNVIGRGFSGGNYDGGGANTIANIELPELVAGSGEVLYIQNIKPIQRNLEQKEEFKILIGF